jgi:hypothetical protein
MIFLLATVPPLDPVTLGTALSLSAQKGDEPDAHCPSQVPLSVRKDYVGRSTFGKEPV